MFLLFNYYFTATSSYWSTETVTATTSKTTLMNQKAEYVYNTGAVVISTVCVCFQRVSSITPSLIGRNSVLIYCADCLKQMLICNF